MIESSHLVTNEKKTTKKGKGKTHINYVNTGSVKCFFCKKGQMKRTCPKFKIWLEKKGNIISLVCYESNIVHESHNTWQIDFCYAIRITNTMKGFLNQRKLTGS